MKSMVEKVVFVANGRCPLCGVHQGFLICEEGGRLNFWVQASAAKNHLGPTKVPCGHADLYLLGIKATTPNEVALQCDA